MGTSNSKDDLIVRDQITQWLNDIVIDLNLCPFAKKPFSEGRVSIAICLSDDEAKCFEELVLQLQRLEQESPEVLETTLLVMPNAFASFDDFLLGVSIADELLDSYGWRGEIQLASFHPEYRFEGEPIEGRSHYTNRSPYPIFHLIREGSLSFMLDKYPDAENIPSRNMETLNSLSDEDFSSLFAAVKKQ